MPRPKRWAELVPGLAALAALTLGAAAVLLYARVGALHGETVRLYAATARADGILAGSEVWLGGQKIGRVDDVRFAPPSHDTTRRVLLVLDVLEAYRPYVRRHADVSIKPGGNIIGARVVQIAQARSENMPSVSEGDTLVAIDNSDVDFLRSEASRAGAELPFIAENVRMLASHLSAARGTLGAFGVEGAPDVDAAAARAGALIDRMTAGDGTFGRAVSGGALSTRARRAMARLDSVRSALVSGPPRGGASRSGRGDELSSALESVRAELDEVQRLLGDTRGTAGRLQHDRALQEEVARARREAAALATDVQRNPLRYLNF